MRAILPKLQVDFTVNPDRGDKSEIEDCICDPRNAQKQQCSSREQDYVEVNAECGLGYQRAEWRQERVLSHVRQSHHVEGAKPTMMTACECEGLPYSVSSSLYSDSAILRGVVKERGGVC